MKDNENSGFSIDKSAFDGNDRDIVSHSSAKGAEGFVDITSFSTNGGEEKKRRNFKEWFLSLTKLKKSLLISGVALFLALVCFIIYIFPLFFYNRNDITNKPQDLGFDEVIDEKIINVALFGIDTRNQNMFRGNSDSIMILSINMETKKVKVISLLRDTLVPIEKNGKQSYGKLNSAYGTGGPELGIKTINKTFDLDIKEYAAINFFGMVDIIDAVGGIDITITEDELKWKGEGHPNVNGCMDEICGGLGLDPNKYHFNSPGVKHANGVQAVAYARSRVCRNVWGTNNDYGRTDRQRYVMHELFKKATELGKSDMIRLAKALLPCTETSFSMSEILDIAFTVFFNEPTFEECRIPMEDFLMPGPSGYGSIVYFDIDYATRALHSIIYEDNTLDGFIATNPVEKNDWYKQRVGNSGVKPSGSTTTSSTTSQNVTPSVPQTSSSENSSTTSSQESSDVSSTTSSGTSSTSSTETSSETSGGDS